MTTEGQLRAWVNDAPTDKERDFRRAIHVVMLALASSERLRSQSYIKGGQLMAIRYGSTRFTTDLDISSPLLYNDDYESLVPTELQRMLPPAVERLGYGLDCRIQRSKKQPPRPDATFVTLKISVGYARFGTRQHKRLLAKQAATTIDVDYSFDEHVADIDRVITEFGEVQAYGLITLMAEKYRALLQQPSRNRQRRQDVYDLDFLLRHMDRLSSEQEVELARVIWKKARARMIEATSDSISNEEIYERAKRNYPTLADELREVLPDFDQMFERVRRYYEGLPWDRVP